MSAIKKFAGQVIGVVLLGTVVLAAAALIVAPKVVGGKPLTVLSGSMQPAFDPGDVVVVRPVDPSELKIGDVITLQRESNNPELTTHRIVAVQTGSEGVRYVTQGDANDVADLDPIKLEQVKGEVWYSVPKVGFLSIWLAGGAVRTLVDLGAVALLLYGGYLFTAGLVDRRRKAVTA